MIKSGSAMKIITKRANFAACHYHLKCTSCKTLQHVGIKRVFSYDFMNKISYLIKSVTGTNRKHSRADGCEVLMGVFISAANFLAAVD